MELTFTGTGTGFGVPVIGCGCRVCRSRDPRNRRLRCGAIVRFGCRTVALDTPPDMREQMLRAGVSRLDAVLYTHEHADHIHGIDDLRRFNQLTREPIRAWAPGGCAEALRGRFSYALGRNPSGDAAPCVELAVPDGPFDLFGVEVAPCPLVHGSVETFGWRLGPVAYLTDLKEMPESSRRLVRGAELLVVDALRERPHPMHMSFAEALELVGDLKPSRAYLTHFTHDVDYAEVEPRLPRGVHLAYDGLTVQTEGTGS